MRRFVAWLLKAVVLSVLVVGSCVGPTVMYQKSPWWYLEAVEPDNLNKFFIAFEKPREGGGVELDVASHAALIQHKGYPDANFHLPDGKHTYRWDGGGSARIHVESEPSATQHVYVYVSGDTPWTALSEYRVKNNRITALRHGLSNGWFLLGAPLLLVMVAVFWSRVASTLSRWLKVAR